MRLIRFLFLLGVGVSVSGQQGFASTRYVDSGEVKEGNFVELRTSYSADDDSEKNDDKFLSHVHYEKGFNDFYRLRLVLEQKKLKGEELRHDQFSIENGFQVFNKKDDGFLGEVRFIYDSNDTEADNVTLRLNSQFDVPLGLKFKQNLLFDHEVGEDSTSGLGFRSRSELFKKIDDMSFGLTMFNDFGNLNELSGYQNQEHAIEPFFKQNIGNGFYKVGLEFGISEAEADQSFVFFTGYQF